MTEQELRDYAADHISYELSMLYETAMCLEHGKALDTEIIVTNALVESFAIHARTLAQFLYYGPRRPGDVTAEEYVRNVRAWKEARGSIPPELQEVIDRTGKEIAHLTIRRPPSGDPQKRWNVAHVFRLFFRPLHVFLAHTEPARLDVGVAAFINELENPEGSSKAIKTWVAMTPGESSYHTSSPGSGLPPERSY